MHTLAELAAALNRPPVYISGVQKRFELPVVKGTGYAEAYLAFLRTVVGLRMHNISEDTLRELWELEKKLLQLLHEDSTGSATWFLDHCGPVTHRARRLLLSNYDLGVALDSRALQPGLDFADRPPELFAGKEMGEDALRVLDECVKLTLHVRDGARSELAGVRRAAQWVARWP